MLQKQTSVVIIDDHSIFRSGVVQSLVKDRNIVVKAQGSTADEALALCREHAPDIVLMDISLPGDGLVAARVVREEMPGSKVIMLTVAESEETVRGALDAGATGYVLKGVSAAELVSIIHTVARGETYVTPSLINKLVISLRSKEDPKSAALRRLTEKELVVLRFISRGFTNLEISQSLGFTEQTSKFHIRNILAKLNCRNRTEAALLFQKHSNE